MKPSTTWKKRLIAALLLSLSLVVLLSGCRKESAPSTSGEPTASSAVSGTDGASSPSPDAQSPSPEAHEVDTDPTSVTVLVNKQYALPDNYNPEDLVYPDVPFLFKEKIEKRMMRKEAAAALEKLFAAAKEDGIYLAGVSAYRSHATQTALFNRYVAKDGEEKAKTYSAVPGHSEHETGLAIDVSGSDGKFAAEPSFAGTPEAEWLAAHAADYGYIIRYPEGKDAITGYTYEPWHIRYVGEAIAKDIASKGSTLEEYYGAVPASSQQ
ncbi:M15 family metallopeptidase [Gorillibacterium timonense]|uniref:M15 family metallopeptidase n=1 Tax=Gorillibacterium timonense TaxID=1689269 RepID=UPI00071CD2B6|nr:M15 family metallopeptidase [Gorillibacterium timonense]